VKRVLFVDDEPHILEGLQRMLRPLREAWDVAFASSGQEALDRLAQAPCDVLVTDIRMPGMNGIELLSRVIEQYPFMARIVLSGTADQDLTLRSVTLAHQYLLKPCNAGILREKVEQAMALQATLANPKLKELIYRLHSIPSIPSVYWNPIEMLQAPKVSPKDIGQIIRNDPGMSAKVLQLVNSGFFGLGRRITSPAEAAIGLGVDTVKALALSVCTFSQFNVQGLSGFSIEGLQEHSLRVGLLARQIAASLGQPCSAVEDAFLGGLMHDIGKLVLASNCSDQYQAALLRAREDSLPLREVEQAVFGTAHDEVGGHLLWLWGLPASICDVATKHHRYLPDSGLRASPVMAVHIADALVNASLD
jgi:HD-like signal output (HDOD) protein/CheY-like chemotaxis protein